MMDTRPNLFLVGAVLALGATATASAAELYAVTHDGRVGYIDAGGKMVIEPRFDEGRPF
jgi:hypothetical protein